MRRDYFTLEAENVDWIDEDSEPAQPQVTIEFDGPATTLRERLTDMEGELLTAKDTDVAFRLQSPPDAGDATGVISVTNRTTGDFVLELNEDADSVLKFIRAARRYGERDPDTDGRYSVRIRIDGDELLTYDKQTFLVYDDEGNLLRKHSLIPSGVEL
jgi:hypothetical protein